MDPDEVLAKIRESVQLVRELDSLIDENLVLSLVDSFESLDAWIVSGGFLPSDWN